MIRVLQIVSHMDMGGIQRFLMDVYQNIDLDKVQFDFLLYSPNTNNDCFIDAIESLGGRIYRVSSRSEGFFNNYKELNDFFLKHNYYKIVHMHESSLSYIAPLIVAKKHGIPIRILHSRNNGITGSKMHLVLHYLHKYIYKKYINYYFAISKDAGIWMFGKKEYYKGNVKLLKNGINVDKFVFNNSFRREIRKQLNYDDTHKVIGHVGRFCNQKNHKFLIEIFYELSKKNSNYKLLLIGSGNTKAEIIKIISEKKLDDKVIVLDAAKNIENYYNAMDIFILPSLFEGLGRVLIEAQCNGLPCFATKDKIPNEVNILHNFKFVPLTNNSLEWVNEILNSENCRINNSFSTVEKNGFNIIHTSNYLQKFYLENGGTDEK